MRTVDLIRQKRDGLRLSGDQLYQLIDGYVAGKIPDYQMAAFLMAVYFRGMEARELSGLTRVMMYSGETYDLSAVPGLKIDKHSTGGVGDKVSLVLAPLAAACGLIVPMVSGRSLGHTGGTLDKLESLPGVSTQLTRTQLLRQLRKIGVAIGGQTRRFVPADQKLYALRDVTGTVESIPLIAASIMSKKLAVGCDGLVLDVKTGNGAFMQTRAEAIELAKTLVAIGLEMGRQVSAVITDMSQPLGFEIGNAREAAEAIDCLKGRGPEDVMEVTRAVTARMLTMARLAATEGEALGLIRGKLESGEALERFRALIEAQGGNPRCVDNARLLPQARKKTVVHAPRAGYVGRFDTRGVGLAATILGAGRSIMTDEIDPAAGIRVLAKIGDRIEEKQPLFEVYHNREDRLEEALSHLRVAVTLGDARIRPPRLVDRRNPAA